MNKEAAIAIAKDLRAPEKERDQAHHEATHVKREDCPDLPAVIHTGGGGFFEHKSASEARKETQVSHEELERRFHEFISDPLTSLDNCPAVPPPTGALVAFRATFGEEAIARGDVHLKLHPLYKRWCVFARGRTPKGNYGYYPALVICHPPVIGVLPADLDASLPPELRPQFTGRMGPYKEPDTLDFTTLTELADRYKWKGRSAREKAKELEDKQLEAYKKVKKDKWEETRDFVEYFKGLFERDMNRKYGAMQGFNTVPQTSLDQFEKEHPRELHIPVTDANGALRYWRRIETKLMCARMTDEGIAEMVEFQAALRAPGVDLDKVKAKYLPDELIPLFRWADTESAESIIADAIAQPTRLLTPDEPSLVEELIQQRVAAK